MLTITKIKELYNKYEVAPSKRLGQNFLVDQNILNLIIEKSHCKNEDVIEIGPGLGSLTLFLLDNVKSLLAYEIDQDMVKVLKEEFKNKKFLLLEEDFLKSDFDFKGQKTIVANIPYYITSQILFKIFENNHKFKRATLMIQKEVAQRLTAPVGSKTYGKLTVTANLFTKNMKLEKIVKPTSFMPMPKVDSAIISFDLINKKIDKSLIEFIKLSFAQRRKTLANNLKRFNPDKNIPKIMKEMNLKMNIRPQELSVDQFLILYKLLKK